MVTLKDIAKHANVSICTVSKYLSSSMVVKKETEQRIQLAIKELGYVPNVVAKALKRMETSNIAVILPKINNLYYSEITSGISQTLGKYHYNLYIYEVDNLQLSEEEILQLMRENMIAGIIFIGLFADQTFQESINNIAGWDIPVVYANRYISNTSYPLVYPDLVQAGEIGTKHLLEKGKERLAVVHKGLREEILHSFLEGCQKAGGKHLPIVMEINDDMDLVNDFVPQLLAQKIEGLFTLNELSAVYLAKALQKADIKIPQDIAVLSLGNSVMSEISTPELTCVDLQNRELGMKSAELILSQIRKEAYEPVTVLEPFIVKRHST
ncbi:LacI family DNA-binding transcriptional regulator [Lysinibacillus louembei]|uniref:LacI family DNA-binding transcriptional regulator n=1 Tax=Lysinibacillus louembei TaxID=1470088 RepID=A0ABZ0S157_9BACI|nr:LacI family DNA-binding transcriptional regulator [Lysinibacillus louembei]WPK13379.1 LacI family DNA-binding transcriptional regulator [Lysinibacillus louembei]